MRTHLIPLTTPIPPNQDDIRSKSKNLPQSNNEVTTSPPPLEGRPSYLASGETHPYSSFDVALGVSPAANNYQYHSEA